MFLRRIEYYKGILFLTTNRVGSFDDAFVSRIHVVIKYEKLGDEERKMIWRQFFDKLEEEREDFVVASRAKEYVLEDEVVSKVEWNGREIRNSKYQKTHYDVLEPLLTTLRLSSLPDSRGPSGIPFIPRLNQRPASAGEEGFRTGLLDDQAVQVVLG